MVHCWLVILMKRKQICSSDYNTLMLRVSLPIKWRDRVDNIMVDEFHCDLWYWTVDRRRLRIPISGVRSEITNLQCMLKSECKRIKRSENLSPSVSLRRYHHPRWRKDHNVQWRSRDLLWSGFSYATHFTGGVFYNRLREHWFLVMLQSANDNRVQKKIKIAYW